MIELDSLTKNFGRHQAPAVKDLTFTVRNGEVLGFVGLNGAGKTTTINCASGVLLPTSGTVMLDGADIVKEKPKASAHLGWVSEFPAFEQNAKPRQLLDYFLGFHNVPTNSAENLISGLLRDVGLEYAVERKLRTFSQGMKKRFALATAMISDPQNYLLDEVLNGLDPEGIHFVKKEILKFKKEGKTVLLSTHILGILEDIADRIAIIHKGELKEIVSRDRLKSLGKPEVKLRTNRLDEKVMEIVSTFGKPVLDNGLIRITGVENTQKVLEEVGTELVRAGYSLTYLDAENSSLEEYFLELTEGSSETGNS